MSEPPPAPPVPASLSIVTLGVADLGRSIRFYTDLGWRRASSSVDGVIAWFDLGTAWLGLYEDGELAADSGLPPGSTGPAASPWRGATYAINVERHEQVAQAVATAAAAGAVVTVEPVTTDYGVHHACFTDPDGHVWEVAHNPGFPIVDGRTTIP